MKKPDRNALVALPVVIVIAALVALAGSQGGSTVGGLPVFALCVIVAFVIQWVAFVPAYLLQTERFFDLTGGLTYITVAVVAVLFSDAPDARSYLLLAMVVIWAVRWPPTSSCASARPAPTRASTPSSRRSPAFSTRGRCRGSG